METRRGRRPPRLALDRFAPAGNDPATDGPAPAAAAAEAAPGPPGPPSATHGLPHAPTAISPLSPLSSPAATSSTADLDGWAEAGRRRNRSLLENGTEVGLQKPAHISKDYSRPIFIAGPGQFEDIEFVNLLPPCPSKETALFELPSFREVGPAPPRPAGWALPKYYIRHREMLRDDWAIKEYECDEEDRAWVAYFQKLGKPKAHSMSESQFEAIIDRLEKEYYALVEEEDRKEVELKQDALGSADTESVASSTPPGKRRRREGRLTVAQLEQRSKQRVERQRQSLQPEVPSWEALHCVGVYWQRKREQVRARHAKLAEELMRGGPATWRTPERFPLASLNACKSLMLNFSVADGKPYYTVCDHIFLIPRLQEEFKVMHNLNLSTGHRRPPRHPLDTAKSLLVLHQVRHQMETARCLMDRLSARERLKRSICRASAQTFHRELHCRGVNLDPQPTA